jgi:uncharacterized lipoprotein YddW (UPF0748 family)
MSVKKMMKCVAAFFLGVLLFLPQISIVKAEATRTPQSIAPKHEMRAAWIASVENIDWPSAPGLSIAQQKSEFIALLDDVKKMGMNAVVVQIKPTADAFYPSQYAPWSKYLAGVQGKDPGYDPLAFMVKEAHKRNLEFHAWFNPYRITMPAADGHAATLDDLNNLAPNHPARRHPDWVVPYGKQLYFNPGIPEVQQFIVDEVMEVVKKYDIDAVHMDDYFYPYRIAGQDFPDQATYEKYGAKSFANKDDWRRDNVTKLIKGLHASIKAVKPYVKFGISPFGVWRNSTVDPTGSNTLAGQTNYDDLFADTREWINQGYLDYITPQIYWNIGFNLAAYDILVNWWANEVKGKNIDLYIGQADYKINVLGYGAAWGNPEEMPNQIALNRTIPAVKGSMHFSISVLNRNPLGIKDRFSNDVYKTKALIPAMPWIDHIAPKKPKLDYAKQTKKGIRLVMSSHSKANDVAYYVIYRFDGRKKGTTEDAANLLDTVRKTRNDETVYTDPAAESDRTYTYVITACDRTHNESGESRAVTIKN